MTCAPAQMCFVATRGLNRQYGKVHDRLIFWLSWTVLSEGGFRDIFYLVCEQGSVVLALHGSFFPIIDKGIVTSRQLFSHDEAFAA